MNEEITIPFYNDLLFKYFISDNDDPESMYVLKTIIETITPIRVHELYVMNSELIPTRHKEKKSVLDVRVQTNQGEFINIEVQSTGLFETLHTRFQYYAFKNIATQIHSGQDYQKLKPVYVIVLFNDEDRRHHELVRKHGDSDEKYHESEGSLYYIYYVFLKEINRIIKEKGKENLNELEELSYLIEKGSDCDRINMTKVGQIMKKKYDKFMEDMNLREEAWAYEKAEFDRAASNDAYYEKGKLEAKQSQTIKFYQMKYPESDIQWLENLTEEQYDEIFDRLLNDESLDDLKG